MTNENRLETYLRLYEHEFLNHEMFSEGQGIGTYINYPELVRIIKQLFTEEVE